MKRSALALMPWLLAAGLPALAADDTLNARILFQRDGSGKVTALVLEQGGSRRRAPRQ